MGASFVDVLSDSGRSGLPYMSIVDIERENVAGSVCTEDDDGASSDAIEDVLECWGE